MSGKKEILDKVYKNKLREKLYNDTKTGLEECNKIVETLKRIDVDFKDLEKHFLFQYYDTYKDVKTSCEILVHHKLMDRKLVDLILIKWVKKIKKNNEKEWYEKNKKEWFDWLKDFLKYDL